MDCTAKEGAVEDGTAESHETHNSDNMNGAAELDIVSVIN